MWHVFSSEGAPIICAVASAIIFVAHSGTSAFEACDCGAPMDEKQGRGPCVCLFYEYGIYVPPPPSDPIYYYYGMGCPENATPGTICYADTIRRIVGGCQCSSPENCPDPASCNDGNCFKPDGRLILCSESASPAEESKKHVIIVPPRLGQKPHPILTPERPVVILTPSPPPGFSAKLDSEWFGRVELPRGKKVTVKFQKVVITAQGQQLPGVVIGETVLGHGVQVKNAPDESVVDLPMEVVKPVLPPGQSTTSVIIVHHDGVDYIVLLAEIVKFAPVKAGDTSSRPSIMPLPPLT